MDAPDGCAPGLRGRMSEALFQQALALQRAGRDAEAEALYHRLGDWRPDWVQGNLGVLLRTSGRLPEAEAALRRALAADPKNARLRYTLGMILLQRGAYAEGWRMYEGRRETIRLQPAPPLPEWRGEPLAGKRLLVVAEQGQGDQILLARFLPQLRALAGELHYAAPRSLVRLFAPLADRVFNPTNWDGVAADVWSYPASAAAWLAATPDDAPAPYLAARPAGIAGDGPARRLGLMLQGDPRNGNNARRVPPPNVEAQIRALAPFADLSPAASGARDFADTAQIVAGLDLVVTIDTAVAHLAGAMGKPCLVLLPRPAIDWWTRWDDDCSPWYPSVRTLRQPTPGDWPSVLTALRTVLADRHLLD